MTSNCPRRTRSIGLILALYTAAAGARAHAQAPEAPPLTLGSTVAQALDRYPAIAEARARATAAEEGVAVARTAYLPRLDLLWQENRASTNNLFGLLLPQPIIPAISGPVLGTTTFDSVWGSAGGMLASWEPVDFGQRRAAVDVAQAQTRVAAAQTAVTRLSVATAAADAYIAAVASRQAVRAAEANVDRLAVFAKSVHALVDNELRPGAEGSRADAELAAARTQLAQARQTQALAQAALADAIGAPATLVALDAAMPDPPADSPAASPSYEKHPAAVVETEAIAAAEARQRVADRSALPHVSLQASLFGRGSGAKVNSTTFDGSGAWLQVSNWALGASVTYPALEVFGARARSRVEAANVAAEQARYAQTIQNLKTQDARARALVAAAREIAVNTPVQLAAARETETRARARYQAGLAAVTEVADAQRLLAQAETDDAISRLAVWRALLAQATLAGDLDPFLASAGRQ